MKIAVNIKPLESGHKIRGIGYYTENLIKGLEKREEVELVKFREEKGLKDVDLVHYPWFDLFYKSLPFKSKYPRIVTVHDVMPLIFRKNYPTGIKAKANLFFQKLSLKNSNLILTDSQVSKKDIGHYLSINENKIRVIYLAPDESFRILKMSDLLRVKSKHKLSDDFILYVGDANFVKNVPTLVKAFIQLKKKEKYKFLKLVLVGQVFLKNVELLSHPELQSLKEALFLIKENNLSADVIKPGFVSEVDLPAFFNLASVYVQPSFYEGFGLPILQAFACGTPVVCSSAGSLPEIGGDAAIYFSPDSLNQLVAIVEDVLQNKSLQDKLSKLGLKQAEKFSWQKTIQETIKVYEDSIKR